jgi:hypothetical protein
MRAFYSTGDLELNDRVGVAGIATRQGQRSWGYDAKWRKQVDASSRVALRVGYHTRISISVRESRSVGIRRKGTP